MDQNKTTDNDAIHVQPTFVLLFTINSVSASFKFPDVSAKLEPIPDEISSTHIQHLEQVRRRLLGTTYINARRIERRPVTRLALGDLAKMSDFADVYLITHKSGALLWEVWLNAPVQEWNTQSWLDRLRLDLAGSLAEKIWQALVAIGKPLGLKAEEPDLYFPFSILRISDMDLAMAKQQYGAGIVRLLHMDISAEPMKSSFIESELHHDFCLREQGLSVLSRRGAIDVHALAPIEEENQNNTRSVPRNALPFLITLEMLALERTILRRFNHLLAKEPAYDIDELVDLKREVMDGLEEYYGTLANSNNFSAAATRRGKDLLGINELYKSLLDRLEMVTFAITTRFQRNATRIGVWLTILFGAIETGFVAASISTWYYNRDALWSVLGWTGGMTAFTAILLALFLYRSQNANHTNRR